MTSTITVQPSGRRFDAAEGENLLDAALRQSVLLPFGCQAGACGVCKCRMSAGSVQHGEHLPKALSIDEEKAGWILPCVARAASPSIVLESRLVADKDAPPIRQFAARITALERLAPDVLRVRLQAAEAIKWRAGQYLRCSLPDGTRRGYSLANIPPAGGSSAELELHIRRMTGGQFTSQLFEGGKVGDEWQIEGALGSFTLAQGNAPAILLASGTGFAPIKAIIELMRASGDTRPATLYWGGRRPQDLYLDAWVREQCAAMPNLRYVPVISDALPEDGWNGRDGFVHRAVLQDAPDWAASQVFVCGAPVVVDAARSDFIAAGLPATAFFADAFTPAPPPKKPAQ